MGTWTALERWASICSGALCCQFPPKPGGVSDKESRTVRSLLGPCKDPRLQPPPGGVSFWWSPCSCFSYHTCTESRKLQGPWPRGGRRATKGSPSFSEGHENRVILQQMPHGSANAGADVACRLARVAVWKLADPLREEALQGS